MAANCSSDVTLVIDYIDNILMHGTPSQISSLKAMFGMEAVEHNDDFAVYVPNDVVLRAKLTSCAVYLPTAHTYGNQTASTQATLASSSSVMPSR
jgi:hypothetical protein